MKGFTLVELLLGIVIASLLGFALYTIFTGGNETLYNSVRKIDKDDVQIFLLLLILFFQK